MLVAVCASGFAQSERVEMGWTGTDGYFERRTPSGDHPLQYYLSTERQQEFLRAATDDCAVKSVCDEDKVESSQQEIGAPFGQKGIPGLIHDRGKAKRCRRPCGESTAAVVLEIDHRRELARNVSRDIPAEE